MNPVQCNAMIEDLVDPKVIAEVLKANNPSVEVYIVGGAVRDYLFHQFHGDPSKVYKPKDTDLTTNLSEAEILVQLRSPLARLRHIGVKEKQSIDTFGVVFANVEGRGPYEIAPFRKDGPSSDGRHPDHVERGTIYEDAMRRDLTINNLYYDMDEHVILDFNPHGQGIQDIQDKVVRTVGDPFSRFEEDKLRVLRLVRFFSRFNPGLIVTSLDSNTLSAIERYKNLHSFRGMSPERIQTEFLLGLTQSLNTANYLLNYADLDLLRSVFPNCEDIDLGIIPRLHNIKSPRVVLAALLRRNSNVGQLLNALCYPTSIIRGVEFLIRAMKFEPQNAVDVLRERDRYIRKNPVTHEEFMANAAEVNETRQDLRDLMSITDDPKRKAILNHLCIYSPLIVDGEELMMQGLKGPQIGARQKELIQQHYSESLASHLNSL